MASTTDKVEPSIVTSKTSGAKSSRLPSKRLILGIAIVIVIGFLIRVLFFTPFRTISYNNGHKNNFSLKFYHSYYLSNDPTSTSAYDSHNVKSGFQNALVGLASKKSIHNKYPIWFGINTISFNAYTQSIYKKNGYIPCYSPTVFTITIKDKQRVPICELDLPDRPAYSGAFVYKQKIYFILVTQVATKQQLDKPGGKKALGLTSYQSDIKTIIDSIKPLK